MSVEISALKEMQNRDREAWKEHISGCFELGKENRERLEKLMDMSSTNARECIAAANKVQYEMQKTFLKYMAAAVAILVGAH